MRCSTCPVGRGARAEEGREGLGCSGPDQETSNMTTVVFELFEALKQRG
jgi:hypothetical protein